MDVALYRQDVALERSVRASTHPHHLRSRLFARLEHEGVWGFGEVAPQPFALNGDPSVDEVVAASEKLLDVLEGVVVREGAVPSWTRVTRLVDARPEANAAAALLEMAVLDRELRATGRDVADLWPARYATPAQATVSLLDDEEWSVSAAARVRVKCAPGPIGLRDLERVAALAVPVILDFNCSATDDDEVLAQVGALAGVAVIAAVEQPYGVGNLVGHARLARRLDVEFGVALSLDESIRSLHDVRHVERYAAASMICVKPARVGGLANARTVIDLAGAAGLRVYLGGFFESPFARGVHRALARHAVSEPSDVAEVALAGWDDPEARAVATSFGLEPSPELLAAATRLPVRVRDES